MDVTKILVHELDAALGVPCYPTVPADRPDSFVTVECTGGTRTAVLSYPSVAVQSWAATQQAASELAEKVDEAMRSLPYGESGITNVEGGVPYPFPSTERIPRYQALYSLTAHN